MILLLNYLNVDFKNAAQLSDLMRFWQDQDQDSLIYYSRRSEPEWYRLVDLTNDGQSDIILVDIWGPEANGNLFVFKQQPDRYELIYNSGARLRPYIFHVGDINNDGIIELLFVDNDDGDGVFDIVMEQGGRVALSTQVATVLLETFLRTGEPRAACSQVEEFISLHRDSNPFGNPGADKEYLLGYGWASGFLSEGVCPVPTP